MDRGKILIGVIFVLVLFIGAYGSSTNFVIIDNKDATEPTVVYPVFVITAEDSGGAAIDWEREDTRISGNIYFDAEFTNFDDPDILEIENLKLEVYEDLGESNEGAYKGAWLFERAGAMFSLTWDTTDVENGRYVLKFVYTLSAPPAGTDPDRKYLAFSVFLDTTQAGEAGFEENPIGMPRPEESVEIDYTLPFLIIMLIGAIIAYVLFGRK
jgi:hypothetical protein